MSDAGDILKSGPVDKAADLLHKLAGPMFDEFGAMLADKVRVYRVKNLVSTVQKTERILRDAGLPANAVPPRLLLPIVENCSVEDNETLQEMWAGLLATASQQSDAVSPSFVETLKQLTPDEARYLDRLCSFPNDSIHFGAPGRNPFTPHTFTERGGAPQGVSSDTYERLGLIRRDFKVTLRDQANRIRNARSVEAALDAISGTETELAFRFEFTEYAIKFLDACHGPRCQRDSGSGGL